MTIANQMFELETSVGGNPGTQTSPLSTPVLTSHHLQPQFCESAVVGGLEVETMTPLYEEELPPPAPSPPARRSSRPPSRRPKRFIETAASGSASKRAKPAQCDCNSAYKAQISLASLLVLFDAIGANLH